MLILPIFFHFGHSSHASKLLLHFFVPSFLWSPLSYQVLSTVQRFHMLHPPLFLLTIVFTLSFSLVSFSEPPFTYPISPSDAYIHTSFASTITLISLSFSCLESIFHNQKPLPVVQNSKKSIKIKKKKIDRFNRPAG